MTLCAKRRVCLIRPEVKETADAQRVNSAINRVIAPLPFNAAISRMRSVDTTPIPLADVVDGLVLHRAVRYLLKASFYPIMIFFGPHRAISN